MSANSDGPTAREQTRTENVLTHSSDDDIEPKSSTGAVDRTDEGIRDFLQEIRMLRNQIDEVNLRVEDFLTQRPPATPPRAGSSSDESTERLMKKLAARIKHDVVESISKHVAPQAPVQPAERELGGEELELLVQEQRQAFAQLQDTVTKLEGNQEQQWHSVQLALTGESAESSQGLAGLPTLVQSLQQEMAEEFDRLGQGLAALMEPESDEPDHGVWRQAIFGSALLDNTAIESELNQLQAGILRGEPAAVSLAGHLMTFRSASADEMLKLLMDVGEAYHHYRPKVSDDDDPFEVAFQNAIQSMCEAAGVMNRIELVHLGDRLDSNRHKANARGGMITQVHGWVVWRADGKQVYTKANVTVE